MEIFKLFGSIFIDNEKANKSIDETDNKGKSVASTLGNMVGTAAKWGTAIVAGATTAAGGLLAATNQTAAYADEIDKLSERTGINREELQRWKYAAEQSGADVGKLEVGVKKLSDVMDGATKGSETNIEAFKKLGISMDDLKNKSQEEIFNKVMEGLANMEQGAERNALGNDLLGKSYTEMLPLLNAGAEGMDELKKRADELGIVMSEDAVMANVQFGDSIEDVKAAFGGIVRDLTDSALPMMQQLVTFLLDNMPMIQEILGGVFSSLSAAVAAVLPLIMDLASNVFPMLVEILTQVATGVLPPLITLFTDIVTAILPILVELITGIVTTILPPFVDLLNVIVNTVLPPLIDLFTQIINTILPPLMELFNQIISTLLPPLIELFTEIIEAVMPFIIELFNEFIEEVLPPLMELIGEIVEVILPPLLTIFRELAELVLPLVISVFQTLMPIIEPIMKAISALIKTVLALIKGDWEGAWNGIKEFFKAALDYYVTLVKGFGKIFSEVFQGIKDVVLDIWDGLVSGIKSGINWIIKGINSFIRGINAIKIPDWVPGVGGFSLSIPTIPLLANGGEIIKGGRAIVGDAGPELLELPQGAKVKPLDRATGEANIYIELDGKTLAKATRAPLTEMIRVKTALSM